VFKSDTDTEVLVHLIATSSAPRVDLAEAVRLALQYVVGAYAIVVLDRKDRRIRWWPPARAARW
jgi:glucosamine--fructose-6-phosphate aminotransferase (isomerizing)